LLIFAFKFLLVQKLKALYAHSTFHRCFLLLQQQKLTKPKSGMVWTHPWGQHSHLQRNFLKRIATRSQREVMATMVLQEINGYEVVVGRTDTGMGGSDMGHATPDRASAESEWMAILVSNDNQ
jgi:hypothetical protein